MRRWTRTMAIAASLACGSAWVGSAWTGSAWAAEPNANASLIYYDMAGNETLDPAEPQNNSSYSHEALLAIFDTLIRRVRKVRIMGSAALALTYVASGRMDAYLEGGIRLWDIAAGGLILERAGGDFWHRPLAGREFSYELNASNGPMRKLIQRLARKPADSLRR